MSRVRCPLCGRIFGSLAEMGEHLKVDHRLRDGPGETVKEEVVHGG